MRVENTTSAGTGKTALVTGGARRIGAAIVRALHAVGANVVIHYHSSADEGRELARELEQSRPGSTALVAGNLLDRDRLGGLIAQASATFGGLDLLVNNASSFYPTPLGQVTGVIWDDLIGTNLQAPFFLSQAAFPELRSRGGSIVNIVDIHAQCPMRAFPVYSIAKAGLAGLTRALAMEMAPAVRVNGVAPGAILWPELPLQEDIDRILECVPLGRAGDPEDIAAAVRYLALEATYVTGVVLAIDGGRSLNV